MNTQIDWGTEQERREKKDEKKNFLSGRAQPIRLDREDRALGPGMPYMRPIRAQSRVYAALR